MNEPSRYLRRRSITGSLLPLAHALRRRLLDQDPPLIGLASRSWEIAPMETAAARPAIFLPDQLARVTGWAFTNEHPGREMMGGFEVCHGATRGFLFNDVWLIDGALYKAGTRLFLQPPRDRLPRLAAAREIDGAAIYCTPGGNKYFGQWLMDDCVTYPLAAAAGVPLTTARRGEPHVPGYEAWLGMLPERVETAFMRELTIFDDVGQNSHKGARFRGLRDRLASHVPPQPHPGVFVLRGRTGQRRVLSNELELAQALHERRGLRVVEPSELDVPAIVAACAGARVVVGVEGSGLMHGVLGLTPGGAVLALQPPDRFVGVYKHLTDRDDQHFAFVVGTSEPGAFRVELADVERTLDLLPIGP